MTKKKPAPTPTARSLHRGLAQRRTPESVAADVRVLLDDVADRAHQVAGGPLTDAELRTLPTRESWYSSSMSAEWERVTDLSKPLAVLGELMNGVTHGQIDFAAAASDPDTIRENLAAVRSYLALPPGPLSFKTSRLNRAQRKKVSLGHLSRRRYDKLFRLVARLSVYADELEDQQGLARLARFAKIGLAVDVPYRDFAASRTTACFVAYYAANLARRSQFIAGPQKRAFNKGSETLFRRLEKDPDASWYAVAHVFPRSDVVARLSVEQRVDLLDKARAVMEETAGRLGAIAATAESRFDTMIVKRGDDSSTWNALAGAWNKARDVWFAMAWAIEPSLLDAFSPGKVLRLMAADVAAWHRAKGGGLDPNTRVWALLPRPWEVFTGEATCTRAQVETACREASVDPEESGWTKPRPRTSVDEVSLTPETVYGVVVDHPDLARLLRRARWFSGKDVRPLPYGTVTPTVERDAHGFATLATITPSAVAVAEPDGDDREWGDWDDEE